MCSHISPVIRFVTTSTDRKASIQEQTIHPVTCGSKVMPWQWEQWLSNLGRKLHQPVQVCNEAFGEEELDMLFTLIGSFVFLWAEVDNVMSFTRTRLWEIFVFLFGAFTSAVLRGQHKTPIYFLYWRMWSALHWTVSGRSPLSSHPSKSLLIDYRGMINSDI